MGFLKSGPFAAVDAARLDDEVAVSSLPISLGGGLLLVLVGLAHLVVLPASYRVQMAWLTLAVGALLLLLRGVLLLRPLPRGWGHAFVAFVGVLLIAPGVALLAYSQDARHSVNLMLVVLGGGAVMLSFGWLLVVQALAWFSYSALVALAPAGQEWVHFGSAFLAVSVLAFVLVAIHRSMFERLYSREAALASTLKDLQRSNEALEQFAYAVSHDLQAPIRSISSYAAVLRDEHAPSLDDEARACVVRIEKSAVHMAELVRDLLEYARVGSRGAEFKAVALDVVLDRALANLSGELSRQSAEVSREPLPKVQGDEVQLVQLFQNLVGNAIKFHGEAAPRVHIAARREGEAWIVSVADNGIGVAPEYHERIFRVFERLHSGDAYPGTGIGLATCKRVVERHGGHIWLESTEGQGPRSRSACRASMRGLRIGLAFSTACLVALVACGGPDHDARPDASADAVGADTLADSASDLSAPDAPRDAAPDEPRDAAPDAPSDVPDSDAPDAASDADAPGPRFDPPPPTGPYAGFAVLGNGRVSAAYSEADGAVGLAHLFVGSFALDVLEAGRTRVFVTGSEVSGGTFGLDPFFAAFRQVDLPGGGRAEWRVFVGEADAVIVQGSVTAGSQALSVTVQPTMRLRASPHLDGGVTISSAGHALGASGLVVSAAFSDGTVVSLGAAPTATIGPGESEREMVLSFDLAVGAGASAPFRWALGVGRGAGQAGFAAAQVALEGALALPDALAAAAEHWSSFAPATLCAPDPRCTLAAANLYAARASSLGGQVPADLTGQFVTNGRPQLYPRDALMVARALHLGGHDAEAWQIVRDWLDHDREGPPLTDGQPAGWYGAWYARYDALGRAVDAGSGAAFDVPEWDSNAYLAVLVEQLGSDELTASARTKVLTALDWLVAKQQADGLWEEGGIIEWTGRLPGTAMAAWAGLDAGARLADAWGDEERAMAYRAAGGRVRGGLLRVLFDLRRLTLADLRAGGLYYDTSLLFGSVWGYPVDPLVEASLGFALAETTALGGGVRYFESPPGHPASGYGQDLFHFTTAGAAQVALTLGQGPQATTLVDWMVANTNRYGLAPERVFSDGSGAAPASPLSWCAAEVATTLRAWLARPAKPPAPVVDGELDGAEYLARGAVAVDADGRPDVEADPVAVYAARDGATLWLGLRLAGETAHLPAGARYVAYLADAGGEGWLAATPAGQRLDFRTAGADDVPGAAARVVLDPRAGTCFAGGLGAVGQAEGPCAQVAVGHVALEARLDLAAVGLAGPVQVIVASGEGAGATLVPAGGSLQTDGAAWSVLATFEVAMAGVEGLNPAEGRTPVVVGDRPELGAWDPTAVDLFDDGTHGDRAAADQVWSRAVLLPERGEVAYKYLLRNPGGDPWAGVEFTGDDRHQWVQDADATGRVRIRDLFGVRGGELLDW